MKMKAMKIGVIAFGYTMLIVLLLLAEIGLGTIIEFYGGYAGDASWAFMVEYATAHSWYIPVVIGMHVAGIVLVTYLLWPWIKKTET